MIHTRRKVGLTEREANIIKERAEEQCLSEYTVLRQIVSLGFRALAHEGGKGEQESKSVGLSTPDSKKLNEIQESIAGIEAMSVFLIPELFKQLSLGNSKTIEFFSKNIGSGKILEFQRLLGKKIIETEGNFPRAIVDIPKELHIDTLKMVGLKYRDWEKSCLELAERVDNEKDKS